MLTTMLTVPVWLLLLIAGGFGVIIGSYLNVVIYRFNTGKSSGRFIALSFVPD
jgi:prepilin signal peptidase PulO-like enzyme (type II secretory pathway)